MALGWTLVTGADKPFLAVHGTTHAAWLSIRNSGLIQEVHVVPGKRFTSATTMPGS
jgi:hypothetical protein